MPKTEVFKHNENHNKKFFKNEHTKINMSDSMVYGVNRKRYTGFSPKDTWKKISMAVVIILVLVAFVVVSKGDFNFSTKEGRQGFINSYFGWMKTSGENVVRVTSYTVGLNWTPKIDK